MAKKRNSIKLTIGPDGALHYGGSIDTPESGLSMLTFGLVQMAQSYEVDKNDILDVFNDAWDENLKVNGENKDD